MNELVEPRSNPIKPDQSCLLVCPPPPYVGGCARSCGCATFASFRGYALGLPGIKANQTGSNQIKPNQTCIGEVSMAHGVARERNGVRRGLGLGLRLGL
jgi:hypothetical protein